MTVIREEVVSGRTRRTYALTGAGANAVRAEAERMAAAARVVTGPAAIAVPALLRMRRQAVL